MATSTPPHRPRRRLSVVGNQQPANGVAPLPPTTRTAAYRLIAVWGILVAGIGALGINLFRLQIVQSPSLTAKARDQQMTYLRPFVPRRAIVDRNGDVLAIDQAAYTLYAHPKLFKLSRQAVADRLATLLKRSSTTLLQQLQKADSGIQVEYSVSEDVADRIADAQIDGLELIKHQQRLYLQQDLAADVLGYVNTDRQGQSGVEYSQQTKLEREAQPVRLKRTGAGALIPDQLPGGFLRIDDLQLQLTLDMHVQRAARLALKQQVQRYGAKRGVVIVMDVQDGSIRALASEPTYNPNQYYKFNVELFKNWALTDLYEPGSTFKPLNVAIALETGAIKPDSMFNDEGRIFVDIWPIEDYDYSTVGGRGMLTVTEILQHSSNVGMVRLVQQMKPSLYYSWLEKLGLGQKVGIDLPFESATQLKTRKQFIESPIEPATTSFGQGFSLTPIQLVQLQAMLGNGGKLVTPHVVRGLFDASGQSYWQPDLLPPRPVFSPKTTQAVLAMMEKVVTNGTGSAAQIPGYRIAGKTGTAQKANPNGGYYKYAKITSFVGIFPVESPRYVVLAVIDEPQGDNAFGSTVAAPIVKSVIEKIIAIDGIPPNRVAPSPKPQ